jgi:hypothetical protein
MVVVVVAIEDEVLGSKREVRRRATHKRARDASVAATRTEERPTGGAAAARQGRGRRFVVVKKS